MYPEQRDIFRPDFVCTALICCCSSSVVVLKEESVFSVLLSPPFLAKKKPALSAPLSFFERVSRNYDINHCCTKAAAAETLSGKERGIVRGRESLMLRYETLYRSWGNFRITGRKKLQLPLLAPPFSVVSVFKFKCNHTWFRFFSRLRAPDNKSNCFDCTYTRGQVRSEVIEGLKSRKRRREGRLSIDFCISCNTDVPGESRWIVVQ